MAIGKNKKISKRKGSKKKMQDPFLRKEWYDVRAPSLFPVKVLGKTICTKTTGQRVARDTLLGRVFEVSQGDLKPEADDDAFRKIRLKVEDVQGMNCLTNFYGMTVSTDKLRALVRKWQTLIEAFVDVKTTDGYTWRLFAIGFTKRRPNQRRKTSYAQTSQVYNIRKKMLEVIQKEASSVDSNGLFDKLSSEVIGKEIERSTQSIYPLQNCIIRKVKLVRAPKTDLHKLVEMHGGLESLASSVPKPVLVAASATGGSAAPAAAAPAAAAAAAPASGTAAAPASAADLGKKVEPKKKAGSAAAKKAAKKAEDDEDMEE